jgi:hypothetical protein
LNPAPQRLAEGLFIYFIYRGDYAVIPPRGLLPFGFLCEIAYLGFFVPFGEFLLQALP